MPTGLSPTSLATFHQCPRRFEEEKIKGMYSPPGMEAMRGTFVHRILELLMQRPPEERTIEVAKECARLAWPETENHGQFKNLDLTDEAKRQFRWDGWTSVENYFAMEPPAGVEVVATERKVNATLNGVLIRGIIDRLDREDGKLIVSDYKNGKLPTKYDWPEKQDQLNLYAAMVQATDGELPAQARLIFTAHSEIIPVDVTEHTVAAVVEKAKKVWDAVAENFAATNYAEGGPSAFKPKVGSLCAWCPAMMKCPEGKAQVTMLVRMGKVRTDSPGYQALAKSGASATVRMPARRKKR